MSEQVDLTVLKNELVKIHDTILQDHKKYNNNAFYFDQAIYEVWASNIILKKIDFAIACNVPLESVETFVNIDGKVEFAMKN